MKRTLLLLSLLGAAPVSLSAQAVVMPTAPLDAARTRVRDAMLVLRDSLMTINGAAARLQRDFRQTSGSVLTARARGEHRARGLAEVALETGRGAVDGHQRVAEHQHGVADAGARGVERGGRHDDSLGAEAHRCGAQQ